MRKEEDCKNLAAREREWKDSLIRNYERAGLPVPESLRKQRNNGEPNFILP